MARTTLSTLEPSICVCGCEEDITRVERRDLMLDGAIRFRVGRCVCCGIERLNPRPPREAMGAFYRADAPAYDPYQPSNADSWLGRLQARDRRYGLQKRLRAIERYHPGGRLLDIGAATGAFIEEVARSPHWQATGVELNATVAESARQRGIDIRTGTLEAPQFPDSSFDVVSLWDVLEHLHDPLATLRETYRILRPNGLVVASTPNLDSWDRKLFGSYWIGYELPRHLYLFSADQAVDLVERAGFVHLDTRSFFGSHAYFMTSLRFWAQDRIEHRALRRVIDRIAFSLPVRLLMAPYFWEADRRLRTTTMTLFARKAEPSL